MPGAGDLRGNQRWEHRRSYQPSLWASAAFAGSESIRKPIERGHTSHIAAGIAGAALGIIGNQVVAR